MFKRKISRVAVVCLFSWLAFAQSQNGRILGTVTDPSGAVVVGAKVVITDSERGISQTYTSNASGDYVAPTLRPALYTITAESAGFKKVERPAIRLEVGQDLRIDFQLKTGSASEVVTVMDEAPLVNATTDVLGGTFTNKAINELPLNGRDFQNLVTLRPGVQRYPGGGFLSISSNGNRPEDNNFIVDGTDNNDPYYATTVINAEGVQGTPATHLPIDAIQEFNAEEQPPAEYGWKPGAIVNVGLKSGTNSLHGDLYDFERNSGLDARNYFNPVPGKHRPLRMHQFGGTVGGPIVKDKFFFFTAYEGTRDLVGNSETLNSPNTAHLPTPASAPNCSFIAAGDCANSLTDALADVTAASQVVPGVSVSQLSTTLAPLFPTNDVVSPDGPGFLNIGFPNRNREDNGLIKLDYALNQRNAITGRYFIGDSVQTERDIPVLRPEWQSQAVTRAQVLGANWIFTISPRWINEAKFGFNRFNQSILTVDANVPPTKYGINTGVTAPINFGMPEIAVSGFISLGGNHGWPLLTTPNQTFQFADNISYNRGKHALKVGGEFRHGSTDNIRDRYGKSRIRFEGQGAFATSTPLEDFLAGVPATGRIFVGDNHRLVSLYSFGAFVQDDWRVTTHFTVNAGMRYDLSSVIKEKHNLLGNFDPKVGLEQVGAQVSSPYNGDHNNFSPRVGMIWDPSGNGKTVIRAGAGIIYEIPHISEFIGQNGVNNASTAGLNAIPTGAPSVGLQGGKIVSASVDTSALNWSVAGPVFSATADCTSSSPCNILGVNRNLRTPYVSSWNLNIQRAITSNTSLQVGYVGSKGTKLYSVYDINQVNPALDDGSEQFGRPFTYNCPVAQGGAGVGGPCFPYLAVVNYLTNGYESKYDGLQTTLTQRAWRGVSFVAGYTWSHALDQASFNRGQNPQDSTNPAAEYGSGDNDIRHRFTFSMTYDIPGRDGFGQMLKGWQITSIVTLQSGLPWNVVDGFLNGNDASLTGEFSDRWNFTGNPLDFKALPTGIPFVDPSNFSVDSGTNTTTVVGTDPGAPRCLAAAGNAAAQSSLASFGCYVDGSGIMTPPAAGTFGTMKRNIFRGPGYHNWDFSVTKVWNFHERVSVQLRGEFFNILNHPNFTNPNGVGGQLGNVDPSVQGSFGGDGLTPDVAAANPVIGSGGPRAIQLGLKVKF
jgi:Carboxypeptidase regulatory-like domain/TonB dependent receptor